MGHADHSMRGRYTHTFEAQLAADAKALDEHTWTALPRARSSRSKSPSDSLFLEATEARRSGGLRRSCAKVARKSGTRTSGLGRSAAVEAQA
jgi:hypothetical protein